MNNCPPDELLCDWIAILPTNTPYHARPSSGLATNRVASAIMARRPTIVVKQRRRDLSLARVIFAFAIICAGIMALAGYTAYRSGVRLLAEIGASDAAALGVDVDWENLRGNLHEDLMMIRRNALPSAPGMDIQSKGMRSYLDRIDAAIIAGQSHPGLLASVVVGRTTHACPVSLIDQVRYIHVRPNFVRIDFESCQSQSSRGLSACLKFRGFPDTSTYLATLSWHGLPVRCGQHDA